MSNSSSQWGGNTNRYRSKKDNACQFLHQSFKCVSSRLAFENQRFFKQIAFTNYLSGKSQGKTSGSIESRQWNERAKKSDLIIICEGEVKDQPIVLLLVCELVN